MFAGNSPTGNQIPANKGPHFGAELWRVRLVPQNFESGCRDPTNKKTFSENLWNDLINIHQYTSIYW